MVIEIFNRRLWERYIRRKEEIAEENGGMDNEKLLFHGSPFVPAIVHKVPYSLPLSWSCLLLDPVHSQVPL